MKKCVWILTIVLFSCQNSNSVSEDAITGAQIPEGAIVQNYESIPGLQKAVVKSGELTVGEGDFLDGQYHGTWTTYDTDGKVNSITTYYKGKKQGVELVFDNLGYVQTKASYHQDQLNGEYIVYNRRKISERRNYSGGQLQGLKQKFYADGTTMEESYFVDGTIDGIAKWYDQDGNLKIEYEYNMGELVEN